MNNVDPHSTGLRLINILNTEIDNYVNRVDGCMSLKELCTAYKATVDEVRKLENEGYERVENLSKEDTTLAILHHLTSLNTADYTQFYEQCTADYRARLNAEGSNALGSEDSSQDVGV